MNEKQLKSDNLPLPRTLASSKSIILRAKQQSSKAALLLHGMTSSPYELEEVGLALHKQGFDVFIPCLSGHGDTIERLKLTPTSDWTEDAVSSREYLFDCGYESVAMLGQSFGGLLALYAMANSKPREGDKLVVMAVPMQLRSSLREYLLLTLSYLPEPLQDKLGLVDKKTPQDETAFAKERKAFRQHSIGANARMIKIRRQLLPRLKNISCPVFYLQDPQDHHVSGRVPFLLRKYCTGTNVVSSWIPGGNHALAMGLRRDHVIEKISLFLAR